MVSNTIIGVETPDFVALSSDIDKAKMIKDLNISLSTIVDIINKPSIKNAMLYLKILISNTLSKLELTKLIEGKTVLVLPTESKSVIDFLKRRKFFFGINEHYFCAQVNGFNRTAEITYLKSDKEHLIEEHTTSDMILDLWKPIIWERGYLMIKTEELKTQACVNEQTIISGLIEDIYSAKSEKSQPFTRLFLKSKNGHNMQKGTTEIICFGKIAIQAKENLVKGDYVVVGGVSNHFEEEKNGVYMIKHQVKAFALAKAEKTKKPYESVITDNIIGDKSFLLVK